MDKNVNVNRERRGHQVAFGDDTDELDTQPVGARLPRPREDAVTRNRDEVSDQQDAIERADETSEP
jgi:hypothetical protein